MKSGWRLFWVSLGLLIVIGVSTWALFYFSMPALNLPLAVVLMLFIIGALIWFAWFVARPWALWYSKHTARDWCTSGLIKDPVTFEQVCTRLLNSKNDEEATRLYKELKRLQERKNK
jgi:hypothetical protein